MPFFKGFIAPIHGGWRQADEALHPFWSDGREPFPIFFRKLILVLGPLLMELVQNICLLPLKKKP
jgi:hypothetical protein